MPRWRRKEQHVEAAKQRNARVEDIMSSGNDCKTFFKLINNQRRTSNASYILWWWTEKLVKLIRYLISAKRVYAVLKEGILTPIFKKGYQSARELYRNPSYSSSLKNLEHSEYIQQYRVTSSK